MKHLMLVLGLALHVLSCEVSPSLIDALIEVESHGRDDAVGDGGKSIGCLQIQKAVVDDVNFYFPNADFEYDDRWDRNCSRAICRLYLSHWGDVYESRSRTAPSDEVLSRIWNGGPEGYKRPETISYWIKVRSVLKFRRD